MTQYITKKDHVIGVDTNSRLLDDGTVIEEEQVFLLSLEGDIIGIPFSMTETNALEDRAALMVRAYQIGFHCGQKQGRETLQRELRKALAIGDG